MPIGTIANGEGGASVREKLNALVSRANEIDGLKGASSSLAAAIQALINTALSGYATDTELAVAVQNMATDAEVATAIAAALLPYATDADLSAAIANFATDIDVATAISTALGPYATDVEVAAALAPLQSAFAASNSLLGQAFARPGDARALFSSALTGSALSRAPITVGLVATSVDLGSVLRIRGVDTDDVSGYVDVARRIDFAIDAGRTYLVTATIDRNLDPSDPANNAVEIRWQNLNANKANVSNVRLGGIHLPTVAGGPLRLSFVIGKSGAPGDIVYTIPPSALYGFPLVRVYGNGAETDIASIDVREITDDVTGDVDISELYEAVASLRQDTMNGLAEEAGFRQSSDNTLTQGVNSVTSEVGAARAGASSLAARIAAVLQAASDGIANEASLRQASDSTLTQGVNSVTSEVNAARGASASLAARIAVVLQAASDGIAAEAGFRQSSDNTLTQGVNSVTSEVGAARAGASSLAARIAAVLQAASDGIANEASLRQASDSTLTQGVNSVTSEVNAARGASASLAARIAVVLQAASDGIAAEAGFRQSSDNTLTQGVNSVTSEVGAARAGASSLAARIAAVLQAASDGIANEASLRQASDSTLTQGVNSVTSEVNAARGASASLAARIAVVLQAASDGIAAEAGFRQSSDNTLTQGVNLVTSEVVAARGVSTSLAARIAAVLQAASDGIAAEAGFRQSTDNALTTAQNLILDRLDRVADRQVIGIAETPVTGTTATDQTFVLPQPVTRDGYLGGLFLFAKAAGVVKVRRYKKTGDNFISIAQDYLVPVSAGLNLSSVDNLGTIPVFAGDYLGIYGNGILCYLLGTNSGFYGAAGDQPSFADNTIDTSAKLQVQFVVNAGAAPAARGFVSDAVSGSIQTIGIRKAGVTGDSLPRNTWVFSEPVARDSKLSALRAYAHSEIVVKLKRFVKAGNSFNQVGKDYPVRLLGGPNTLIEDEVGAMALKAGEYIGFSNDGAGSDLAFLVGAGVEAGYFTPLVDGTNTTFLTDTTADYGARIQIGFDLKADPMKLAQLPASAPLALEETILDASISAVVATGLSITCRALVGRSGMGLWTPSQTIALAATASTNIRFDLLYYDVSTKQLGIIQGTERAGDPDAFMPKRTSLRQLPIAMLRVYQATVQWTMLYELVDGVMPQAKAWRDQIRSENRRRAKTLTARAASRQAIKLISFGDSINAQHSSVPSSTAPNGTMRDRSTAVYLAEGYGSDVLATIPLYTAVQLGRADDGAGVVHTRVGMAWEVVSALEKQGYVLGQDLVYDNWSVAGWSSADAVSGSTPTSWLTSAAASGAHAALVPLGMNELGNPDSETRLTIIGQTFLAAGILPIFVGVARPRTLAIHNWAFTNRLIKRVADALDVPFVPVDHLYDDRFIAALGGLTTLDVCPSNKINHPGLIELPAIGREIVANLHLGIDVVGLGAMSGSTSIGRSLLRSASQSAARTALGLAPVASSGSAADLTGTILDAQLPDRLRSTIVSVTNWDLAIEPGFYTGLDTALNSPVAQFCFGIVKARGTAHCEQILTEIGGTLTDSKTYRRIRSNSGAFSVWQRVRQTEEELNTLYARLSAAVFTGPPQLPPYTVATLPAASATPRGKAWASNGRAFTGLGMQEASGAGTGVEVISNGSAWKISGTNVTVSA